MVDARFPFGRRSGQASGGRGLPTLDQPGDSSPPHAFNPPTFGCEHGRRVGIPCPHCLGLTYGAAPSLKDVAGSSSSGLVSTERSEVAPSGGPYSGREDLVKQEDK